MRILQIFNRYLQYGGEEGSVFRIGDALQERHDVEYFIGSSEQMLSGGAIAKLKVPFLAIHNTSIIKRLEQYQKLGRFQSWMIHNVFPGLSPGVYSLAFKMEIPVVHYLHNYKFGCVNGFLFHHGKENRDCLNGNFWPAVRDATWRNSRLQTAVMAGVLAYTRHHLKIFDNISHWIAISEAQKAIHVAMGIPEDRIDVVPHFLPAGPLCSIPQFPEKGYALFVGRLSPEKGVDRLLTAWAHLPKSRKLVIMGDGPEKPFLMNMAKRMGLDNIHFAGFVPAASQRDYWSGASFSVVPSIWQETFGMVVLESWARGRPVVAHRIGALPEIISEGVNGFLADPEDPIDLARKLSLAFDNERQLEAMGMEGFSCLKTKFNRQNYLNQMDHVYQKIRRA